MPFTFKQLDLPDALLIEPKLFQDERGTFSETFKVDAFKEQGIDTHFLQDNYSNSQGKVLRGLHFQAHPRSQGKLISVIQGHIFDVIVDLRVGSPTFGKWISLDLSDKNRHMLWVPPGYAHGFCVLSNSADIIYKCTDYYDPTSERGIRWDDPDLNIAWPVKNPILSSKDLENATLREIQATDLVRYAK